MFTGAALNTPDLRALGIAVLAIFIVLLLDYVSPKSRQSRLLDRRNEQWHARRLSIQENTNRAMDIDQEHERSRLINVSPTTRYQITPDGFVHIEVLREGNWLDVTLENGPWWEEVETAAKRLVDERLTLLSQSSR